MAGISIRMAAFDPEPVRCIACRREYLPTAGAELACPDCGAGTWVAAHIPLAADELPPDGSRAAAPELERPG